MIMHDIPMCNEDLAIAEIVVQYNLQYKLFVIINIQKMLICAWPSKRNKRWWGNGVQRKGHGVDGVELWILTHLV